MVFNRDRYKAPKHSGGTPPELRSPRSEEDIRVHATWRYPGLAMAKASGKFFVVDQDVHAVLAGRMFTCELRAAVSSKGEVFVWPIKDDDTAQKDAAEKAVSEWIRVAWNTNAKTHEVKPAAEQHGEPQWPFETFDQVLDVAIVGRILSDPEAETVKSILAKKKRTKK
jgi:hypothetical protein